MKLLAIILGLTVALILIINLIRFKKGERTFTEILVHTDTADINTLVISHFQDKEPLRLTRNGNMWTVEKGNKKYNADQNKIYELLSLIASMRPERVAGINKDAWKQFEVTDSAALKLQITGNRKKTETLLIGKFSYQQPSGNDYMSMYNRQGKMSTYVRKNGDERTYVVNGFLRMSFQSDLASYRDKTIIRSSKSLWNKLSFIYPADSSFTLSKTSNGWLINNLPADSTKVESFLSSIENLQNYSIEENASLPNSPSHKLKIEGTSLPAPIEITAFPADSINGSFIISSMNKEGVFSGNKSGLFSRIFVSKNRFMPSAN